MELNWKKLSRQEVKSLERGILSLSIWILNHQHLSDLESQRNKIIGLLPRFSQAKKIQQLPIGEKILDEMSLTSDSADV